MFRRIGFVTAVIVAVLGGALHLQGSAQENAPVNGTPDNGQIEGLFTFDWPTPAHDSGAITYPQNPPIGGTHNPVWQACGFYDLPVGNEHAVHSLEHGAVWITYDPGLAADQIETLRGLVNQSNYILISPYQGLPSPIVASSWDKQLWLTDANDARLLDFIRLFIGQAPEVGAPCSGGTSETVAFASPAAGSPVAGSPVAATPAP